MDKDGVYVRRRSWTLVEKRAVVTEAFSVDGNVSAVAKRHGVQCQQIYRWRDRMKVVDKRKGTDFIAVEMKASSLPVPFAGTTHQEAKAAPRTKTGGGNVVEISVAGGSVIRVPVSAGAAFVAEIALSLARGAS